MWFGNGQPSDYHDPDWSNGPRPRRGRKFLWLLLVILVVVGYLYFS